MKTQRVEWIDVFKLLGITAIFCGHLGRDTGGLHDFVFWYHVPLFFFASGIFADRLKDLSLWDSIKKRFEQIMLPYFFLAAVSMVVIILTTNEDVRTYLAYGKQFVFGIRNQMYASSLWFFSCLFCMSILFELQRRIFRNDIVLFLLSVVMYFVTIFCLPNRPDVTPSWIFNIDSALHYMIYYAAGYLFRERLTEEKTLSKRGKFLWLAGAALLAGYAFLVYLKKDIPGNIFMQKVPLGEEIYPVIRTFFLILFHIMLAKLLVGIGNLHEVGEQTLWLCGNEFVVKKIFVAFLDIVGLQVEITSALSAGIYACVMIWFIYRILMPYERKLYQRLLRIVR